HTSSIRDWSSDVCSSDLFQKLLKEISTTENQYIYIADAYFLSAEFNIRRFINYIDIFATVQDKEVRILTCNEVLPKSLKKFIKRSEERRVVKERRHRTTT